MSSTQPSPDRKTVAAEPHHRFTINEDWAATIVGLILLALVLGGLIPAWLVP